MNAEAKWEQAKADIDRHDAESGDLLYELDGTKWLHNRATGMWMCQCHHCVADPSVQEQLSYADLTAEYTVSDWKPARAA